MSTIDNPLVAREIHEHIQQLAEHGYRALGVAVSDDGEFQIHNSQCPEG
jgi:magnesium-transporting ATPase (P-type)